MAEEEGGSSKQPSASLIVKVDGGTASITDLKLAIRISIEVPDTSSPDLPAASSLLAEVLVPVCKLLLPEPGGKELAAALTSISKATDTEAPTTTSETPTTTIESPEQPKKLAETTPRARQARGRAERDCTMLYCTFTVTSPSKKSSHRFHLSKTTLNSEHTEVRTVL